MEYRSGHLESSCTAVLEHLGPVYVLPIELIHSLLPATFVNTSARFQEVKKRLASNISNGRWCHWPNDPVDTIGREDAVFKVLPDFVKSIIDTWCNNTNQPSSRLINNPNISPGSQRSNSSRPDGYFLRQPAQFALETHQLGENSTDYWEDIAVPLEYKKSSQAQDRSDNQRKIIWSMHHILRNDPCRRFTFGITIENTDMSVWLCHRSATIVFESFNFIENNHDTVIKLVASLAFAEDASLGWDPTIKRRRDGKRMFYDIDIHTADGSIQTFIADKILSDFGAEAMQGRGTRVFRAKDVNDSIVVVKDVWQDHDRDSEGDILHELLQKMRTDEDIRFEEERRLFLTVICHGVVMIDNGKDHTLDLIMRGVHIPQDCGRFRVPLFDQIPQQYLRSSEGSVGNVPHVGVKARTHMGIERADSLLVHHRVHYRIVFAELCQPVQHLHNFPQIFQALMDGTRALEIMYKCGFVHRDVSAGNILVFNGRGRLADLEYAKRMNGDSRHDVRTGTVYFMAIEVAKQRYLFPSRDFGLSRPPFKHNPLHDLESIWWIAVCALFRHGVLPSAADYDPRDQRKTCKELFPDSVDAGTRIEAVMGGLFYTNTPVLVTEFQETANYLDDILAALVLRYRQTERGSTVDSSAFDGIHHELYEILLKAKESFPEVDVLLLDEIDDDGGPPPKRARRN